jgi:hypothetical protein
MKDEDIPSLLGGFATGTLTDRERDLLFTAALKDQALFDALADEQVLHDFLSDPASRRQLIGLLQPEAPGVLERLSSWIGRPTSWAAIAGVTALFVVAIVLQQPRPLAVEMAKIPSAPAVAGAFPDEVRRDAPAAASSHAVTEAAQMKSRIAAVPTKMKIAVLDFDSGPAPAREADSASADLGKTASELLGKKLDARLYDVIDRKQVDRAVQAQNLNERQLGPSAAASVGRSVGADAVIVGSVKPIQVRAISGFRDEARSKANKEEVALSATAINTQNALSLGFAQGGQSQASGLAGAVDQVASSLNQQIQQNSRNKIEGVVTDVNAATITLNAGAKAGVKLGDRLEVRRAGRPIGRVVINSAQDSVSIGLFEGSEPVRVGDTVSNQ